VQGSTVERWRRKLGEEEQAAVLLMALSYGSVYAWVLLMALSNTFQGEKCVKEKESVFRFLSKEKHFSLLKLCFLCWPKFNFCWLVFHVVAKHGKMKKMNSRNWFSWNKYSVNLLGFSVRLPSRWKQGDYLNMMEIVVGKYFRV
jgi:hypothetical protein